MKSKKQPIKQTKQTESKIWFEHISIVHNQIRIDIVIDYKDSKISIVDNHRNKKNFMFCERSLSYEQ